MNKLVIGQLREWDKQYSYDQQFILLGVNMDDSHHYRVCRVWNAFSFNDGEYKKYREFDVERYSTLLSE
jgi:hypothetical protein